MTAFRTLLTGMATNAFKKINAVSEETTLSNAQPLTKAEFDFNGSTWANDASVSVGSASPNPEFTWGTAAINEVDGYVVMTAGGHTDSGRGTIMGFNPEVACASINASGSGGVWDQRQPGCRFILGSNSRPSSATSPTGNNQIAPDPSTGFWTMPNKNGIAMPVVVHPWHANKYIPGTRTVLLSGGSGFPDNQSSTNAGFVFNDADGTMAGPFIAGSVPAHTSQKFGYIGSTPNVSTLAMSILHQIPFTINNTDNFAWILTKWTNPTNASIALVSTGVFSASLAPWDNADAIIIPDPANNGQEMYFQHGAPQISGDDTQFLVISDIHGIGTGPTFNFQSYNGASPTTGGPVPNHYAWDTNRKVIWMTDGPKIYKITPSTSLTSWTIAGVIGFTGDTPPDPAGAGALLPSLQYVQNQDCLLHVYLGQVRVYKPTGWSAPAEIASAQPYQPWYGRAPILAQ